MKKLTLFLLSALLIAGSGTAETQAQRVRPIQKARPYHPEQAKTLQSRETRAIGIMIAHGKSEREVIKRWTNFIKSKQRNKQPVDIFEQVNHAIREAYLQMSQDLQHVVSQIQHFNNLKKKIRDEIRKLRQSRSQKTWRPRGDIRHKKIEMASQWHFKIIQGRVIENESELDAVIRQWEEKLGTIGNDAELTNIDLQKLLQKQKDIIQMLSNISKVMHDTAMAVIRNIR